VVKFEGHFHGYHDYLGYGAWPPLDSAGPAYAPIPFAESAGIPPELKQFVIVLPWNDVEALARTLRAEGDLHVDQHHTAEDVGITLGQALDRALADRKAIRRFGDAAVPLDEALAQVAVDLGGRGWASIELPFRGTMIGGLSTEMIPHFLHSFAMDGRFSLHVRLLRGENDHHRAEATFKAMARALDDATRPDPRIVGQVPSTKGII